MPKSVSHFCLYNLTRILTFVSVFRLWAEVFHVSASGAGTVKWQQVSEDLVPVNITCIQDSPECVFHITAYNSQVDKILDVRLVQPGNYTFGLLKSAQSLISSTYFYRYDLNRNSDWTSVWVLCILEGSDDERYMGSELYIANRCQAVQGVLRKYQIECAASTVYIFAIYINICLFLSIFIYWIAFWLADTHLIKAIYLWYFLNKYLHTCICITYYLILFSFYCGCFLDLSWKYY